MSFRPGNILQRPSYTVDSHGPGPTSRPPSRTRDTCTFGPRPRPVRDPARSYPSSTTLLFVGTKSVVSLPRPTFRALDLMSTRGEDTSAQYMEEWWGQESLRGTGVTRRRLEGRTGTRSSADRIREWTNGDKEDKRCTRTKSSSIILGTNCSKLTPFTPSTP